jgi:hypothetical protein
MASIFTAISEVCFLSPDYVFLYVSHCIAFTIISFESSFLLIGTAESSLI